MSEILLQPEETGCRVYSYSLFPEEKEIVFDEEKLEFTPPSEKDLLRFYDTLYIFRDSLPLSGESTKIPNFKECHGITNLALSEFVNIKGIQITVNGIIVFNHLFTEEEKQRGEYDIPVWVDYDIHPLVKTIFANTEIHLYPEHSAQQNFSAKLYFDKVGSSHVEMNIDFLDTNNFCPIKNTNPLKPDNRLEAVNVYCYTQGGMTFCEKVRKVSLYYQPILYKFSDIIRCEVDIPKRVSSKFQRDKNVINTGKIRKIEDDEQEEYDYDTFEIILNDNAHKNFSVLEKHISTVYRKNLHTTIDRIVDKKNTEIQQRECYTRCKNRYDKLKQRISENFFPTIIMCKSEEEYTKNINKTGVLPEHVMYEKYLYPAR